MFPFQQNNEFPYDPQQDIMDQENQILNQALSQTSDLANLMGEGQLPHLLPNSNTSNDANLASHEKKIIRKEIERQRRQQMSTLHASLRNLLPLESIKGKRYISDHINEATKHIKNLENNIKELSIRRDKLKNSSSLDEQRRENESSDNNSISSTVTVRSHLDGVEIVLNCGFKEESFVLSRVLEAVVEEGFDVISCISTRSDERLYNTIQCQATHLTCIDPAALQQKLNDVILSS